MARRSLQNRKENNKQSWIASRFGFKRVYFVTQDSEFNRQFRFPANELTELADEQIEDVPNKYQELIHSFLNSMPKDDQELFIKEVTKMHLYGMTYREIKENTGLGLDTIHKTIKKFKYDLYNYSGGDCEVVTKLWVARFQTFQLSILSFLLDGGGDLFIRWLSNDSNGICFLFIIWFNSTLWKQAMN